MKATAIALLIVSAYWIQQGVEVFRQDTMKGVAFIVLGVLFLPLARYLWSKEIGGRGSSS
jgi:hypothetical protein